MWRSSRLLSPTLAAIGRVRDDGDVRTPRILLLCLLSLGVSLQGFAGVQYVAESCPMMAEASMQGMEEMSSADMAAMMEDLDCLTDHTGAADSKPCPMGNGCQSVGPALLAVFRFSVAVSAVPPAPSAAVPIFHSHHPPLLWRPPALI